MEKDNLATELLREIKQSATRWFILAMVELVALVTLVILLFVVPVETAEETTYSQEIEEIENSDITQRIGDTYGESETDSDQNESH